MQLSFGFGPAQPASASAPVSRLSAILAAARRTPFYGPLIARASSGTAEMDMLLARIPPVGVHEYLGSRERFRNPSAPGGKARLDQAGVPARRMPERAIRGSLEELLRLAAGIEARQAVPPPTARCVVVETPLGERLAPERARDLLWRVFELPLFEELLGPQGETLAFECEAHEGLHLETGSAIFEAFYGELVITSLVAVRYPAIRLRTGWVGAIERRVCPCGEAAARFVPVAATEALRKPPAMARTARRTASPAAAVV
jgi:hypothetical protein